MKRKICKELIKKISFKEKYIRIFYIIEKINSIFIIVI